MNSFTKTTTQTFTPRWIRLNVFKFTAAFRKIRDRLKPKYLGFECFKCEGKFTEGESIALANFKEVGNRVLCESCAKQLSEP